MDKETKSTQVRIYFEFAEVDGRTPPDEDVKFVKSVLEEHDLHYDHYDEYNISTDFFVDSKQNMEEVDEMEHKIENHFDEFDISRFKIVKEARGVQPGTYQTWLSIE